ncbi:MAG: hypothetical protein J6S63_01420 [Atopobiaceae bacterium]|nr:hypothetical protein [Atopobiaceae bacterium]
MLDDFYERACEKPAVSLEAMTALVGKYLDFRAIDAYEQSEEADKAFFSFCDAVDRVFPDEAQAYAVGSLIAGTYRFHEDAPAWVIADMVNSVINHVPEL